MRSVAIRVYKLCYMNILVNNESKRSRNVRAFALKLLEGIKWQGYTIAERKQVISSSTLVTRFHISVKIGALVTVTFPKRPVQSRYCDQVEFLDFRNSAKVVAQNQLN